MTFVKKYMDYAGTQTGAPRIYHYYMGYCLLAQIVGRKAWHYYAAGKKFPNLWFLILGPSSMVFKSTVLNLGRGVLKEYYGEEKFRLPNHGSLEAFVESVRDCPQGLVLRDEFISLLEWVGRDYNAGLMELFTELYDNASEEYRRVVGTRTKREEYVIKEPMINIFACSTVDWFNKKITEGMINGGFLPRFNIIASEATGKYMAWTPKPDYNRLRDLVFDLQDIEKREWGEMTYDGAALKLFEEWYIPFRREIDKKNMPYVPSFSQRRGMDVHKFAMLNAIMRGSRVMNSEDLDQAIQVAQQTVSHFEAIATDKLVLNPHQGDRKRVLDAISACGGLNGGAPHSRVLKRLKMKGRDANEWINTLEEEGSIDVKVESAGKKPSKTYFLHQEP